MATRDKFEMPVLIAGAGIAGLTVAHALLMRGIPIRIFEQANALREVGAGIQIPPNAMKVLRALKLDEEIMSQAFEPEAIEARMGVSGRMVFDIPLAEHSIERWGAPYLHIHRADYVSVLAKNLPSGTIEFGARITDYSQTSERISIQLDDGRLIEGRALIGADGIHSTVQSAMQVSSRPDFTGNIAWRAVVPIDRLGDFAPRPTACAWFGAGRHAVTYRLGADGQLANFVGVVERSDWQDESWSMLGKKSDAQNDFNNWDPTIDRLIEAADELHCWALFDRKPLPKWTDGRVALMGDAAHPMLPFLAQGAAMAVEDAYVLADTIEKSEDMSRYQQLRMPRTTRVQAASRANMGLFHKRTTVAQIATYGPMWAAGKLLPKLVHSRMDWLYGHDVTQ